MIEFSHVSKLFGAQKAVNDLNLNFQEGSFSVLIGTSGSGKSTTLKMINRLVEHDSGVIRFAGEEIRSLPVLELRRRMGYAIQSIGLFPHWSVAQNIATVPQLQKWSRARIDDRIDELMALLGLEPNLRERYPHQLSGGMSQRVMIAMAIACKPRLLIADEPTTALDVTIQAQIVDLLLELQQKECMSLILITHDLALVAEAAHRIIVMYAGQVVEEGRAEDIFREPKHPYTQALLRSLPEFAEGKSRLQSLPGVVPGKYDRSQGCLLNPRCPYATDLCRSVEPELRQVGNRQVKCHTPLNAQGEPSNV